MPRLPGSFRAIFFFICLTIAMLPAVVYGQDGASHVSAALIVNASLKTVWEAILSPDARFDHRRVISVNHGKAIVEETFDDLPLLHSSTCVIEETETPYKRIDYTLMKSDKLKALEGAWILTPLKDGRTSVELQSSLDVGLHIPFTRRLVDEEAMKRCLQRLRLVKEIAESTQNVVATAN